MTEGQTRLVVFVVLFVTLAVLEMLAPRRELKPVKMQRWFTNSVLVLLDSVLVRLVFKTAAVGGAIWAAEKGYGLFNVISAPPIVAIVVSFLVLDFAVWLSHLGSHKIPLLWRIHRMHHSDTDIDVTTAVRFHPLEILLSMVWKYAVDT